MELTPSYVTSMSSSQEAFDQSESHKSRHKLRILNFLICRFIFPSTLCESNDLCIYSSVQLQLVFSVAIKLGLTHKFLSKTSFLGHRRAHTCKWDNTPLLQLFYDCFSPLISLCPITLAKLLQSIKLVRLL